MVGDWHGHFELSRTLVLKLTVAHPSPEQTLFYFWHCPPNAEWWPWQSLTFIISNLSHTYVIPFHMNPRSPLHDADKSTPGAPSPPDSVSGSTIMARYVQANPLLSSLPCLPARP